MIHPLLGRRVRDTSTGIEGVATKRVGALVYGSARIQIEYGDGMTRWAEERFVDEIVTEQPRVEGEDDVRNGSEQGRVGTQAHQS